MHNSGLSKYFESFRHDNMIKFEINCDLGEGFGNESELMPYIQSCNIACGGHAGNKKLMKEIVMLAIKHQVKIGAHPSYPDKVNFGRKTMDLRKDELNQSIQNQIRNLKSIVERQGAELHHIKPHGALYHDIATSDEFSLFFLRIISEYKATIKLYVPFNSFIEKNAINNGFSIFREAFADRNYNDDLSLVSREYPGAIIVDPDLIAKRVLKMVQKKMVTSVTGNEVRIEADTFCIHSDSVNAIKNVKKMYQLKKTNYCFE